MAAYIFSFKPHKTIFIMRTFWFSEEKLFFKNRIITRKITSGKLDPKLFQKKTKANPREKNNSRKGDDNNGE
jgi:hypothetical protein